MFETILVLAVILLGILFWAKLSRLENRARKLEERLEKLESPPQQSRENRKPEPEPQKTKAEPPPLPAPALSRAQVEPPEEKVSQVREPEPGKVPAPVRKAGSAGQSIRQWLQRLYLWPPAGGSTTEVRLASWWATRIGIVLGVIAAVFFGVHVSQGAPPILRLSLLVTVAAVLIALGLRLERRLRQFGQILSAGGLAILYVAAFAAYAFEPMRVVTSPAVGLVLQLLGAGAMAGFSIWKKSEPLATAAILLGYVSCWFSHSQGLDNFTVAGLVVLALAASAQFVRWIWSAPLVVAMAGSYIGYILLIPFRWEETGSPGLAFVLAVPLILLGIFQISLHGVHLFRGGLPNRWRVPAVLGNASAATLSGLVAVLALHRSGLEWYYLAFALAFSGLTALEYWKPRFKPLTVTLFLQAMTGFALFFIAGFEDAAEWFAVAFQAGILVVTLRWTRSRWVEAAAMTLWLVAFCLGIRDLAEWWDRWTMNRVVFERLLLLLFYFQTLILCIYRRWIYQEKPESPGVRNATIALFSILTGLGLSVLFMRTGSSAFFLTALLPPLLSHVVVAASFGGLALAVRTWPPLVTGGTAAVVATFRHLCLPYEAEKLAWPDFTAGLLLLAMSLAALGWLRRFRRESLPGLGWIKLVTFGTGLMTLLSLAGHTRVEPELLWGALIWAPVLPFMLMLYRPLADARGYLAGIATGAVMVLVVVLKLPGQESFYLAAFVSLVAGVLTLGACFLTRNPVPAATGTILGGFAGLLWIVTWLVQDEVAPLGTAGAFVGLTMAVSAVHFWRVGVDRWRGSIAADAATHFLWMTVACLTLQQHLAPTWPVAACAAVALLTYSVSLSFPLFALRQMSITPAVLATLAAVFWSLSKPEEGSVAGLWTGFGLTWVLWLADQTWDRRKWFAWLAGSLTAILGIIATFHAWDTPWEMLSLGAIGLAFAVTWRFAKVQPAGWWAVALLLLAVVMQIHLRLETAATQGAWLASILLTVLLLGTGLLFATAKRERFRPETLRTAAGWGFSVLVLLVAFPAFAWHDAPAENLATVWWGVTGTSLFLGGLVWRVRAYRIAGLAGIGAGIVRMFLVDLDDTLIRIFAFAGVSVALLVIGYLYARFREFIEREE